MIALVGMALLIKSLIDLKKNRLGRESSDAAAITTGNKGLFPVALAIGMVPCPGVVIIMLFTLSQNLPTTGLLLSFFMALGMSITIAAAGMLSIFAREGMFKALAEKNKARLFIQKALTILGALLICLFDMVLLFGAI